jgi:hypothetical protein
MSALSDSLRAIAKVKISKYGKLVTFVVVTTGSYVVATGKAAVTTTQSSKSAIVEEIKGDNWNGNLVKSGDKKFTFAASSFAVKPKPGDRIIVDSETFTIAPGRSIKTTYSGEDPCLYEIQAGNY